MTYDIQNEIEELKRLSVDTPNKPVLPSEELIQKYEKRIGFTFLPDYKKFLKEASNVVVGTLNPLIITENGSSYDELSVCIL